MGILLQKNLSGNFFLRNFVPYMGRKVPKNFGTFAIHYASILIVVVNFPWVVGANL
jgi:hypothetical protein